MEGETEKRPTVKTLEDLAALLGVHRRTLNEFKRAGCPTIKSEINGRYLIAPCIAWFSRMLMRRQVRRFLKQELLPEALTESIAQILLDHEKAWAFWLEKEHKPS